MYIFSRSNWLLLKPIASGMDRAAALRAWLAAIAPDSGLFHTSSGFVPILDGYVIARVACDA